MNPLSQRARFLGLIAVLLWGCAGDVRAQDTNQILNGLLFGSFEKWTNCLALTDREKKFQAVVATDVGARILHYSYDLLNILYWNPAANGMTLANARKPFYLGGYQCDIGPEIERLPSHPELLVGRHGWRSPRSYTVDTVSPIDPRLNVRLYKSITIDPDTGELGLMQRMLNTGEDSISYCLWDRTVCKGRGYAFFKRNPKSRLEHGLSILRARGQQYSYEEIEALPENVKIHDDTVVIDTGAGAAKIGADSRSGWVAYVLGRLLFIKYFPINPNGDYPESDNTLEVMWNGTVTELSPLSPRVQLARGEYYDFPARWMLKPLKREVNSFRDVRRLLDEIDTSPFETSLPRRLHPAVAKDGDK